MCLRPVRLLLVISPSPRRNCLRLLRLLLALRGRPPLRRRLVSCGPDIRLLRLLLRPRLLPLSAASFHRNILLPPPPPPHLDCIILTSLRMRMFLPRCSHYFLRRRIARFVRALLIMILLLLRHLIRDIVHRHLRLRHGAFAFAFFMFFATFVLFAIVLWFMVLIVVVFAFFFALVFLPNRRLRSLAKSS